MNSICMKAIMEPKIYSKC